MDKSCAILSFMAILLLLRRIGRALTIPNANWLILQEMGYDETPMQVAENHHPDRKRALLAPVLLLAIIFGFYWKLTLTREFTWLDNPDLAYQVLPWIQVQASELHQGRLPLWDPNHWGGQSLIGQAQPGTAYPLNWILFSLPLRDGRIRLGYLNFYFVLIHFMAALFCYWLCRDLKRTRAAGLLAGVFFSLGGFMGSTGWPQILNGAVWAPLIFMFVLRAGRGRRPWTNAALSGVCGGMAILSGHHLMPLYTLLAAGGVWLYYIFRAGRPDWKFTRLAAVALLFTGLVGALQILPAYEYGRRAVRWVGAAEPVEWSDRVPYSVHSEFSLNAYSLLGTLVPGVFRHTNPYVGAAAGCLALLALALNWKRRSVRIFAAVALGGLLFSLGRDNVLYGMLYAVVPGIEKAREPAFAIFIFHFGISVLIACGFDSLRREADWVRRIAAGAAILGCAVLISCIYLAIEAKSQVQFDDRIVLAGVTSLLSAAALYAVYRGGMSRFAAAVCLLGLMLVEIGNGSPAPIIEKSRAGTFNRLNNAADVAQFLKRQPQPFRVEVDDQDIPYNFGDWHGLSDMGGYVASVPANVWRMGAHEDRRALYGVAYTVTKKPPVGAQELVFEAASGLKVYRNPGAHPRVWTEGCPNDDRVRITAYTSSRVAIEAEMKCAGLVVLSDNDYPGWRATLDGHPARIVPAHTSMRALEVPAGRHRIEMVYRPTSVLLGALLTAAGLLGAAILALSGRNADAKLRLSSRTTA